MSDNRSGATVASQAPEACVDSSTRPTYVLVTGGVHSGVGKGCAAAVFGRLLARAMALPPAGSSGLRQVPPPLAAVRYLKLEPCLQFAGALRLNDPACEFEVVADPDGYSNDSGADVTSGDTAGVAGAAGRAEGPAGGRRQQRQDSGGQHRRRCSSGMDAGCVDATGDEAAALAEAQAKVSPPAILMYDSDVGRARFAIPGFRPAMHGSGSSSRSGYCCHLSRGDLKLGALLGLRKQQLEAAAAAAAAGKRCGGAEAPGCCSLVGELELYAASLRRRLGLDAGSGGRGGSGGSGNGLSGQPQPQAPQELLVVEVGGTAGEPEHAEMCAVLLLALGGPPALHLHVTQLLAAATTGATASADTASHGFAGTQPPACPPQQQQQPQQQQPQQQQPQQQPQQPWQQQEQCWSKPAQASLRDMAARVAALLAGCGPAAAAGLTSLPEPDLVLLRCDGLLAYAAPHEEGAAADAPVGPAVAIAGAAAAAGDPVAPAALGSGGCGRACGCPGSCGRAGGCGDAGGGGRGACGPATLASAGGASPHWPIAACIIPPAAAAAMAKLGRLCAGGMDGSSNSGSGMHCTRGALQWLLPRARLLVPVAHDPAFPERAFLHALSASPAVLAHIAAALGGVGVGLGVSTTALLAAAVQDTTPGSGAFALPQRAAKAPGAAVGPPSPLEPWQQEQEQPHAQQEQSECGCERQRQQHYGSGGCTERPELGRQSAEVWVVHDGRGEDGCAMLVLRLRAWSHGAVRLRFMPLWQWLDALAPTEGGGCSSLRLQRPCCCSGLGARKAEAATARPPAAVVLSAGAGEALAAGGHSRGATCAAKAFGLPPSRVLEIPNSRRPQDRPDWVGTLDAPEGPLALLALELGRL